MGTCALPDMYVCPQAFGALALGLLTYISGKAQVPMLHTLLEQLDTK